MKNIIKQLFLGLAFSSAMALAEEPPPVNFERPDLEPGVWDFSTKILQGIDGNFVLGYRQTNNGKAAGNFMEKYDTWGKRQWIKRVHLATNNAALVPFGSISTGAIFIAGPHESNGKFYASRYNLEGEFKWLTPLPFDDERGAVIAGIATDPRNSDVIVVGSTFGAIQGATNKGHKDAFIYKLNADGEILWSHQFGSSEFEFTGGVACDHQGNIYVIGGTEGQIHPENPGSGPRIFLAKFDPQGKTLPLKDEKGNTAARIREYGELPLGGYGVGIVIKDDSLYITDDLSDKGVVLGHKPLGEYDLIVLTLDLDGVVQKSMRVGTALEDRNNALHSGNNNIAVDDKGAVYVSSYNAKFFLAQKEWYNTINVFRWMPGEGSFENVLELRAGFMHVHLNSLAVDRRGRVALAGGLSGKGEVGRFYFQE